MSLLSNCSSQTRKKRVSRSLLFCALGLIAATSAVAAAASTDQVKVGPKGTQDLIWDGPFEVSCYQNGAEIFMRPGLYRVKDRTGRSYGWHHTDGRKIEIRKSKETACFVVEMQ